MQPTSEIITKVRLLLGETNLNSTLFTDEELQTIIADASSVEEALYVAWTLKATKVMASSDNISSMSVGAESVSFESPKAYAEYCLSMANLYKEMMEMKTNTSIALSLEPPVLEGIE